MSSISDFEGLQKSYYLQSMNTAIPTSTTTTSLIGNAQLQSAIGLAGADTDSIQVSQYLTDFGQSQSSSSTAAKMDATCRSLTQPGPSMRAADARTGCGWWFSDSPSVASVGAYGSRRGPMNPALETQIGPGRWIWDPAEAQKLESLKLAATVRSCADLGIAQRQNPRIGWCVSTGRAVVSDGAGYPAYPQDIGGDCPGPQGQGGQDRIVMNAAKCPPPQGQDQGQGGPALDQSVTNLCTPGAGGALSPACLAALTTAWGCPGGTLASAFSGGGYAGTSSQFTTVNNVLQQRGFSMNPGIMNDGRLSMDDMWASLSGLRNIAGGGPGTDAKSHGAALNLCYGTPFDPCAMDATDKGPFDPTCITQTALGMGYSPSAKLMPGSIGMEFWNKYSTWGDVVTALTTWKVQADTGSGTAQATAVANVYGTTVKFPKHGCNVNGLVMYRYSIPMSGMNDATLFPATPGSGPQTHFLGRYILKNGFPQQGVATVERTPAGGFMSEFQRLVGNFTPTVGGSYQFLITCSNMNARLFIDGTLIAQVTQGGAGPSQVIRMIAGQQYAIMVDVWNSGGPWAFQMAVSVNGTAWAPIPPSQFTMLSDRRQPMIELAFNRMPAGTAGPQPIKDTGAVLQNLQLGPAAVIGSVAGRQCLVVSGPGACVNNAAKYIQGIRLRAIKSITMMILVSSVSQPTGTTPSLVSFNNLPSTNLDGPPALTGSSRPYTYVQRTADFMLSSNGSTVYPWGINPAVTPGWQPFHDIAGKSPTVSPVNQWFHLAFVWDDDGGGATTIINGTPGIHVPISPPFDIRLIMENVCVGCDVQPDGQAWTGGIAWFRAFDYALTPDLIRVDMNDTWMSEDLS